MVLLGKCAFAVCAFLALLVPWVGAEPVAQYALTPQETGVLVLSELAIGEKSIRLRVPSLGCTTKDDIVAQVVEDTPQNGVPHYVVTFIREVPDPCGGSGEVVLFFDLEEDLHLNVPCILSVTNPVLLPQESQDLSLARDLIAATVFALEREIMRYSESEHPNREEKIALLSRELERFRNMPPSAYRLSGEEEVVHLGQFGVLMPPEVREVEVRTPPQGLGDILEVVGMTRSGPFYHVAGIRGGDFSHFSPSQRYRMTLYLVFRREYFSFIPNYYVYIADWEEIS